MKPDFSKYPDDLMPAVIQDNSTGKVLMLGFMNEAAYAQTKASGRVTFFSRSKNRLWEKGETSGYYFEVKDFFLDCDRDTILVKARPNGPACHTGADTCFNENNKGSFLEELEKIIESRKTNPLDGSYISKLFGKGLNKIAQKVGEEAVELVIEAKDNDDDLFINEAADLLFHYLVLLNAKGHSLNDVVGALQKRNKT